MSPNDADEMANSVDPDQTAPLGAVWSGSALFAQAYLSENLGSLRYIYSSLAVTKFSKAWTTHWKLTTYNKSIYKYIDSNSETLCYVAAIYEVCVKIFFFQNENFMCSK